MSKHSGFHPQADKCAPVCTCVPAGTTAFVIALPAVAPTHMSAKYVFTHVSVHLRLGGNP